MRSPETFSGTVLKVLPSPDASVSVLLEVDPPKGWTGKIRTNRCTFTLDGAPSGVRAGSRITGHGWFVACDKEFIDCEATLTELSRSDVSGEETWLPREPEQVGQSSTQKGTVCSSVRTVQLPAGLHQHTFELSVLSRHWDRSKNQWVSSTMPAITCVAHSVSAAPGVSPGDDVIAVGTLIGDTFLCTEVAPSLKFAAAVNVA